MRFKKFYCSIFFALLVGAVSFSHVEAAKGLSPSGENPRLEAGIEQELVRLNDAVVTAIVRRDTAALDRLLSDDFTYTHSNGRVETKAEIVQALKSGARIYESATLTEVKVRLYGTAAVITDVAELKVNRAGEVSKGRFRYLKVCLQQQGRWRMVAWQDARLGGESSTSDAR